MFKRKSSEDAAEGQLHVQVVEARNLAAKDRNGFSDPYCVLLFGKQKQQTRHIRKTLNPAWGEPFQFATTADPGHLQVVVWDKDRLWRDVWPLPTAIL
ncbi:uncharacterized protein ACA1_107980, partial [Acanthamoeba castellanii str. Neff]